MWKFRSFSIFYVVLSIFIAGIFFRKQSISNCSCLRLLEDRQCMIIIDIIFSRLISRYTLIMNYITLYIYPFLVDLRHNQSNYCVQILQFSYWSLFFHLELNLHLFYLFNWHRSITKDIKYYSWLLIYIDIVYLASERKVMPLLIVKKKLLFY